MFMKMELRRRLWEVAVMFLALGVASPMASAQGKGENATFSLTTNDIKYPVSVLVPRGWSIAPQKFKNARSLIDVALEASGSPSTEVQIYVESHLDHAKVLNQIREITSDVSDKIKSVTDIGGWPAVQIRQLKRRSQPKQGALNPNLKVQRIITYIAVSDALFVITGTLPAEANPELIQAVVDITSSLNFRSTSDVEQLNRDLKYLQTSAPLKDET